MRPFDNSDLTPQDRFREIAVLLATGMLRLRDRAALAADPDEYSAPENPEKTGDSCLELPGETVLSVHTG
ncbi:MAG: hypothetical protein ACK4RK_16445 [Gemmataceae bacterium]